MSRLLVTEADVRAAIVQAARGEVGTHYGLVGGVPNPTPYGRWYGGAAWERALFCAAGSTWAMARGLGEADAHFLIGHQTHGGTAPYRRGYVWTVALWEQLRAHRVPLRDLQPGDLLLFKYPTSGPRNDNPVNHVDTVEVNNAGAGYVDDIGFNVPSPSAPPGTDQSRGGGVWRRRIWHGNTYIVGGIRIPAKALADRNRAWWKRVQQHLTDLDLGPFAMTGTPGPATLAAVKVYAATYGYTGPQTDPEPLLTHMEDTMNQILTELKALRAEVAENKRRLGHLINNPPQPPAVPTAQENARAVWAFNVPGISPFDTYWHLRHGAVLNPAHRAFPANAGSPADKSLRREVAEHGSARIITTDGPVDLVLDEDTDRLIFRTDPQEG